MVRSQAVGDPRVPPISPFTLVCLTVVSSAAAFRGDLVGLIVGVVVLAGVSVWFRVGTQVVTASTLLVLPLLAFLAVLHVATPDTTASELGFWVGYGLMASRIILLVAACQFLRFTLDPSALRTELLGAGISPLIVYTLIGSLRAIGDLRKRLKRVIESQRARGLPFTGSVRNRVRAFVSLIGPLFIGALLDADRRALALEARGLRLATGSVITLQKISISGGERWIRAIALLLTVALLFIRT